MTDNISKKSLVGDLSVSSLRLNQLMLAPQLGGQLSISQDSIKLDAIGRPKEYLAVEVVRPLQPDYEENLYATCQLMNWSLLDFVEQYNMLKSSLVSRKEEVTMFYPEKKSVISSMGMWRMRLEVPKAEVSEMLPLARLKSVIGFSNMCPHFHIGASELLNMLLSKAVNVRLFRGFELGPFSTEYLGLPFGTKRNSVAMWEPIVQRFQKKLAGWKDSSLSLAERVILVKSVLCALPIYFFSIIRLPALRMNCGGKEYFIVSIVWIQKQAGQTARFPLVLCEFGKKWDSPASYRYFRLAGRSSKIGGERGVVEVWSRKDRGYILSVVWQVLGISEYGYPFDSLVGDPKVADFAVSTKNGSSSLERWCLPLLGFFKLNVDGAMITLEKAVLEQISSCYELQCEYILPGSRDRNFFELGMDGLLRRALTAHFGNVTSSMGRWRMRLEVPRVEVSEMLPLARLLSRTHMLIRSHPNYFAGSLEAFW
ncbi:hypothetical protein F3Y22_tig00002880pilonHSYRG00085 [Hibiscus syriacus]|uniref:Uncharacterized protein n=1 Tax=Hibiscus syriacus TaxID=106335 RepID=A0A6A3CMU7_HIBSY|nr:hypothetical protein F3Y22_tig00002880pilonHSYRG00085 [Hibiscus syriacus]